MQAFARALRARNSEWLQTLSRALQQHGVGGLFCERSEGATAAAAFADIAVQLHWGYVRPRSAARAYFSLPCHVAARAHCSAWLQEAQPPLHRDACNRCAAKAVHCNIAQRAARSVLHLALSLHGQRRLVFLAANADASAHEWQPRQVAFSRQHYLLQPQSGCILLPQEHVLTQQRGKIPTLPRPHLSLQLPQYPHMRIS